MTLQQSMLYYGLEYILGHFNVKFPRTISTHTTKNSQITVNYIEEALVWYEAANLKDCKINAYPIHEEWATKLSELAQAPDFLFIDLDLDHFKAIASLNRTLAKTLKNIKLAFHDDNIQPTVMWSGNGYHLYLPIEAFTLESESVFASLVKGNQCSRKFLQFAEQFLSNKKADICHTKGMSFNNCMIRIPGSINSKNNEKVRIIQEWNGVRPAINWLLRDFRRYLIQQVYVESRHPKAIDTKYQSYWRNRR